MELTKKTQLSYSVCIRTLGTAGEKYAETLNSIKRQTIQPKEIIVVIPHGYELPKERIGSEYFVRSEKGMVNQRIVGFENVNSEYTLALDDDVRFEDDFVEKLIDILKIESADFVSPSIIDIENITAPQFTNGGGGHIPLINNTIHKIIGVSWQSKFNKGYATRIAKTGGFIVRNMIDENQNYRTQSGQGAICFGKTKSLKALHFEHELWLEGAGYPLPEDQVMFYKLFLQGNKLIYAPEIKLIHLDAGSSITSDKKLKNIYASARNSLIFWHRFIYSTSKTKIVPLLSYSRRFVASIIVSVIRAVRTGNFTTLKTYIKGYSDGFQYIKTTQYKQLPRIIQYKTE